MKRRRCWPRVVAAAIGVAAVTATLALLQPLWMIDQVARVSPGVVWRVETVRPLVALSFDDGPVPGQTSVVLDLLAEHDARATFFMIGERAAAHPDLVGLVRRRGHEVGNHAYTGRRTIGLSAEEFRADLRRTGETLRLQSPVKLYRPPSGLLSPAQLAIVREEGYLCVMGSAYPYDPAALPVSYMSWMVARKLEPGVIVVLHDGIPDLSGTLEALESILEAGRRRGLRFVSVGELLGAESGTDQ